MKKESTSSLTSTIVRYIKRNGGDAKLLTLPLNKLYRSKRTEGIPTLMVNYRGKILFFEVKARIGSESVEGKDGTTFLAHCFKDFQTWFDKIQEDEAIG